MELKIQFNIICYQVVLTQILNVSLLITFIRWYLINNGKYHENSIEKVAFIKVKIII